jgi:hypothetical protein
LNLKFLTQVYFSILTKILKENSLLYQSSPVKKNDSDKITSKTSIL